MLALLMAQTDFDPGQPQRQRPNQHLRGEEESLVLDWNPTAPGCATGLGVVARIAFDSSARLGR